MNDGDKTVVNLAQVRKETATSTSSTSAETGVGSTSSSSNETGYYPKSTPTKPSSSDGPFDNFQSIAVWAVISLLIGWLGVLTYSFYDESKEIRKEISNNQEELIKHISSSQIDLKNQISEFERRHEADVRELQKMILQQQNKNSNPSEN